MRVEPRSYHRCWPAEVCTLSSDSRRGLIERLEQLASFLRGKPLVNMKDLAYTLNVGEHADSCYRLAFVASTLEETAERVASALNRISQSGCKRIKDPRGIYFFEKPPPTEGRLAFLFPGEGSQYAGMLSDLCLFFPQVRTWFDLMDRAFVDHPRGCTPSQFVFPLPGEQSLGGSPQDRLWQTDGAVEAVFTASQAIFALLETLQIRPDAVVGHSAGDYAALFASGAFRIGSEQQFVRQAREFNRVYEEFAHSGGVPEGILLAVNCADSALLASVAAQTRCNLHLALDNCPHQVIFCGTEEWTTRASAMFRSAGALCQVLPFARAYHTPLFEPVSERLFELLQTLELRPAAVLTYSCVTADLYPEDPQEIRKLAAAQWSRPVRFRETVERMYKDGIRIFVEVGPSSNLTAFVEDILRGRASVAIPSDIAGRSGMIQIQHVAAQLFACGVPVRLDEFYGHREPQQIPLESDVGPKGGAASGGVRLSLRLPTLQLSPRPSAIVQRTERSPLLDHPKSPPLNAPVASMAAGPDSRAQVLEGFFRNTMKMLETEREVMTSFLASYDHRGESSQGKTTGTPQHAIVPLASDRNLPFVRKILSIVPGEVKVLCEIDLNEDRFLTHHTLAGKISSIDERLVGLPVIPLTVSMEILAEVASLLAPGRLVVGMKNVQASRWLVLEQDHLALEITARCEAGGDEIQVELRESLGGVNNGETVPAVVGTVVVAQRYADSPERAPFMLDDGRPSKWRSGRMYADTGMFHGPLFQVVSSIDLTGKQGAQATFTGRPIDGFFRTKAGDQLIDPVTLDAMGQVVGYWVGDHFEKGLSVFPFRLAKLEIFRAALGAGEEARCRVKVHFLDELWVRSDIEVVTTDNQLVVRMIGWEDRRLDLPRRFYDFRISPAEVLLSDLRTLPHQALPEPDRFRCAVLGRLPEDIFEAHGAIWLMVLAYMVLNGNERQVWRSLKSAGDRRVEWLLGRIVAKDAVRALLQESSGLRLCPADIEIAPNSTGAPAVKGHWTESVETVPVVSISHAAGLTIAVAVHSSGYSAVGADVEQIGRITAEVERLVFSARERDLLATLDEAGRAEWATRMWCAKEATGKALGRGVFGSSSELQVQNLDLHTGRVKVAISSDNDFVADLAESRRSFVTAYTGAEGNHAFGTALV